MKWLKLVISAAALVLSMSNVSAAARDALQVRLLAPEPVLKGDVDVTVNVAVTNTTREAVTLMRWELPTPKPEAALFRITRDGEAVAYTGPLVKRAPATRRWRIAFSTDRLIQRPITPSRMAAMIGQIHKFLRTIKLPTLSERSMLLAPIEPTESPLTCSAMRLPL